MTKQEGRVCLLSTTRWLLVILIFFIPLVFLPVTLEPLEMNKQTVFVLLTCVSALCWLGSMLIGREIQICRGWANLLPCFFILAFLLPTLYSVAPYLSWIGAHRQEYTSVLTISALAVLFYLLANIIRGRSEHKLVHTTILLSSTLVAVLGLVEALSGGALSSFVPSLTFNTIGTITSFTTFLIVMNSFFLASFISHRTGDSLLHDGALGRLELLLIFFISLSTLLFLLVLDDSLLWALFSISIATVFVFVVFRAKDFPSQGRHMLLLLLFGVGLVFWFLLPGITFIATPLEVTPNISSSQIIAEKTLQTFSSAYGSGPGTYVFDFSRFHDLSLNETDFWNTRFDRAASFVLTLVPTIGFLGMTLLGVFIFLLFLRAIQQVLQRASREKWLESFVHMTPWLTLIISAFVVPWNMTLMVSFGVFSGLLASQVMRSEWRVAITKAPAAALLVSLVFILLSFGFFVGIFLTTQRYAAEIAFTQAVKLDREAGDLHEIVTLLDRASTLNRFHDTYYRNLGEALLLRVDEELQGVNSVDTLTQESLQYAQSLTSAAVNAVARATELSPNNVLNWLSRGFAYRSLMPILGDATQFALDSYTKAVELEPVNPANWTELGKTYLAAIEQLRPLLVSSDVESAAEAQTQRTQMLAQAESAFSKAIELKPNYAPAHFQLALTYAQQGRLDEAIRKMESVAQFNQLDVGVQFQLGVLYLQRLGPQDLEQAQAAFERAIKLAPSYSNAHWFLASIYEQQGDITGAVREVETVLELNPGNELVETRLRQLLEGQIATEIPEAIEEE